MNKLIVIEESSLKNLILECLNEHEKSKPQKVKLLTKRKFALAIGKSPNTIAKWVNNGSVKSINGFIPETELSKFDTTKQ